MHVEQEKWTLPATVTWKFAGFEVASVEATCFDQAVVSPQLLRRS
jgi:hypothetical protein